MKSDYYSLICSLPHLPAHFDVERVPISAERLEQRLKVLTPQDAEQIHDLAEFLAWDRQAINKSDREVVADYEKLSAEIRHPVALEVVRHRMNVRTIVAAIRRRDRDEGPPVGVGELVDPIRRHWKEPQFGLQRRFPWIDSFVESFHADRAMDAERILYETTWKTWSTLAADFTFCFESIVLYLARWEVVQRWTSRDRETGLARFDKLIEETLGEFATVQF